MKLEINGKQYTFLFDYNFLKEINYKYSESANGVQIRMGIETVGLNILNHDIQTLIEALKLANQSQKENVSEDDVALFVVTSNTEKLFDEVVAELKKSEFTGQKFKKMMKQVEESQQKA